MPDSFGQYLPSQDAQDTTGAVISDAESDDGDYYVADVDTTLYFSNFYDNTSTVGDITDVTLHVEYSTGSSYGEFNNFEISTDGGDNWQYVLSPKKSLTDISEYSSLYSLGVDTFSKIENLLVRFENFNLVFFR